MIGNELHIVGAPKPTLNQGAGRGTLPGFDKNETITGKVLRSYTNGMALLLIKGSHVRVRSHVSLTPGQAITLQVKSLSPAPILKFLGETSIPGRTPNMPVILSALKDNIWKLTMDAILPSDSSRKDFSKLLVLMKEMTQSEFKSPGPELLKLLVSKAGFNLEAKLKKALLTKNISKADLDKLLESDLKGILSKIIGQGKDGTGSLKRLLTAIKNFQLLNQNALGQCGKIYLPIPMQFPGGVISVGQLLLERVSRDDHQTENTSDDEDVHQATFLIDMSRLGPVRAEVMIRGKHVKGKILVTQEKTKGIIKNQIPFLMQTLSNRGFVVNYVECFVKDPDTVEASLLQEIIQAENNSICLVA